MVKDELIPVRVSSETKALIQAAADRAGQSMTSFITEAALKHAQATARRAPSRGVHGGVPTWFRATCIEATNGGASGYFNAGRKLARSFGSEVPGDLDLDEWGEEIAKLREILADDENDAEVAAWFKQHFPKMMALVPTRRRGQFVEGVRHEYNETGIDL